MVKDGYATALTIEPNTKYAEKFEFYQKTAKDAGLGLWKYEVFAYESGYMMLALKYAPEFRLHS